VPPPRGWRQRRSVEAAWQLVWAIWRTAGAALPVGLATAAGSGGGYRSLHGLRVARTQLHDPACQCVCDCLPVTRCMPNLMGLTASFLRMDVSWLFAPCALRSPRPGVCWQIQPVRAFEPSAVCVNGKGWREPARGCFASGAGDVALNKVVCEYSKPRAAVTVPAGPPATELLSNESHWHGLAAGSYRSPLSTPRRRWHRGGVTMPTAALQQHVVGKGRPQCSTEGVTRSRTPTLAASAQIFNMRHSATRAASQRRMDPAGPSELVAAAGAGTGLR
jgi:hypothetical protein